jgi:hypothetical protein
MHRKLAIVPLLILANLHLGGCALLGSKAARVPPEIAVFATQVPSVPAYKDNRCAQLRAIAKQKAFLHAAATGEEKEFQIPPRCAKPKGKGTA